VQEPFNRSAEAVVDEADAQGVAFILWFPLAGVRWQPPTDRCTNPPSILMPG